MALTAMLLRKDDNIIFGNQNKLKNTKHVNFMLIICGIHDEEARPDLLANQPRRKDRRRKTQKANNAGGASGSSTKVAAIRAHPPKVGHERGEMFWPVWIGAIRASGRIRSNQASAM